MAKDKGGIRPLPDSFDPDVAPEDDITGMGWEELVQESNIAYQKRRLQAESMERDRQAVANDKAKRDKPYLL